MRLVHSPTLSSNHVIWGLSDSLMHIVVVYDCIESYPYSHVGQQHCNATSVVKLCDEFLPGQKRRVIKMKKDGNCFYSTLSFQLFGTQSEHGSVRHLTNRTVSRNKSVFKPFFIPSFNSWGFMWTELEVRYMGHSSWSHSCSHGVSCAHLLYISISNWI